MAALPTWPRGIPFRPIADPYRVHSRSRRVVGRYQQACKLIRLANTILFALLSLFSGQPISDFCVPSSVDTFFRYAIANSSNLCLEKRVHSFVLNCARRFLARGGSRPWPISVGDVGSFLTDDMFKQYSQTGSNILSSLSVPLVSESVSLPSSLTAIRMLDFLPPELRLYYENPATCLRPDPPQKLPRPFMGATSSEYVKLLRRLRHIGMVSFRTSVKAVNGVFAVPKGESSQRLILDCRPANALFNPVFYTELPTPADLSNLLLPAGVPVYATKCDLDNYYHRIVVPDWMVPYFGLPKVRASDIDPTLADEFGADAEVFPAFLRLPMGFLSAVHISSKVHEHFLSTSVLRDHRFLRVGQRFVLQIGEVVIILYIDDLVLLSTCKQLLDTITSSLLDHYALAGFVVKLSKYVPPSLRMPILGLDFDGETHELSVTAERAVALRSSCLRLVATGFASGKQLEVLLGHMIWAGLVRRPVLSVLSHIYHFVRACDDLTVVRPIWKSVKNELIQIAYLTPLMFASLSSPVFDKVICTDASSTGGAVVATRFPRAFFNPFHELLGFTKPYHVRNFTADCFPRVFGTSRWSTVFATTWKWQVHINQLEMLAVEQAVRWALSHPNTEGSRLVIFSDSLVCVSALSKGRSSSPNLILPLRRISAWLLSLGAKILCPYVPTDLNPANGPSRNRC